MVFANRPLGTTPEDQLLVQVQGVIAEYEHAKILERTRRGRRHAARCGRVSALSKAPYGYRYIDKHTGGGEARLRSDRGRGEGGASDLHLGGPRWLFAARSRPAAAATGSADQDRSLPLGLRDDRRHGARSTYKGHAFFGKRRSGAPRPRLRPRRGQPEVAKATCSLYQQPASEHIGIAVTALVDAELFATAQERLAENRRRLRAPRPGAPLPSARPVGLRLLWLRIVCTNIWVTTKVYLLHLSWSLCFGADPPPRLPQWAAAHRGRGGSRLGGRQCLVE